MPISAIIYFALRDIPYVGKILVIPFNIWFKIKKFYKQKIVK